MDRIKDKYNLHLKKKLKTDKAPTTQTQERLPNKKYDIIQGETLWGE